MNRKDAHHFLKPTGDPYMYEVEEDASEDEESDDVTVGTVLGIGALTVAGAVGAVLLAPAAIAAAGFTSAGVAAGSLAASFQSAFLGGMITKGGMFALLQSAGATGVLSTSTLLGVGAAGGATAGAAGMAVKSLSSKTGPAKNRRVKKRRRQFPSPEMKDNLHNTSMDRTLRPGKQL